MRTMVTNSLSSANSSALSLTRNLLISRLTFWRILTNDFQGGAKFAVETLVEEVATAGAGTIFKHAAKYAKHGGEKLLQVAKRTPDPKVIKAVDKSAEAPKIVRLSTTADHGVADKITNRLKTLADNHKVNIDLQVGNKHSARLWEQGNILSKPEGLKPAKTYNEIDVQLNPNAHLLSDDDLGKVVLYKPKKPANYSQLDPDDPLKKRYDFREANYQKGMDLINKSQKTPYRAEDLFPGGAQYMNRKDVDIVYENGVIKVKDTGQHIGRYTDMNLTIDNKGIIRDAKTGFAFTGDVDIGNVTDAVTGKPLTGGRFFSVCC